MGTRTISVRLDEAEVKRLESAAAELGIERATFLKWAVRRGADGLLFDKACETYRQGRVTLSRAAEIAGLSQRAMILRLRECDLEVHYGKADLEQDLREP